MPLRTIGAFRDTNSAVVLPSGLPRCVGAQVNAVQAGVGDSEKARRLETREEHIPKAIDPNLGLTPVGHLHFVVVECKGDIERTDPT